MSYEPQNKRDKRNPGGLIGIDRKVPSIGAAHATIVNVERFLFKLFESEIERFKNEPNELRRFFRHAFSPVLGDKEMEEFVTNFLRETPEVVLGYPRTSTRFPCFAIVLEGENEAQNYIGDFAGHQDDEIDQKDPYSYFEGAMWKSTYGFYVYAQHPDVCLYLYTFSKMLIMAGSQFLLSNGIPEIELNGAELSPDETYAPDNMFIRVLRVSATAPQTVPFVSLVNQRRMELLGLYREDVVVDGVRGGVKTPEGYDGNE